LAAPIGMVRIVLLLHRRQLRLRRRLLSLFSRLWLRRLHRRRLLCR
jgi:hypothetical protein